MLQYLSSTTLAQTSKGKDNNLNLMRIISAWGVLAIHSFVLAAQKPDITDPLKSFFGVGLGTFFVTVFFAISGFLISRSLDQSQDLKTYCISRAKRLLPGLTCVLILTTFVLGPLVSELNYQEYFTNRETWSYLLNINLLNIHTNFQLPGVFLDTPYPRTVNGSIWTLPFETWMYTMTAVFFCARCLVLHYLPALKKWLGVSTVILVSLTLCGIGQQFLASEQQQYYDILVFVSTFFVGATLYQYRYHVPLSWPLAAMLLFLTPLFKDTVTAPIYIGLTISYCTLIIAYLPAGAIRHYNKVGDYSYGLYIYAFPVQQTLAHLIPDIDTASMILLTTLFTLPLAFLSWHCIERPALQYRRSSMRKKV